MESNIMNENVSFIYRGVVEGVVVRKRQRLQESFVKIEEKSQKRNYRIWYY